MSHKQSTVETLDYKFPTKGVYFTDRFNSQGYNNHKGGALQTVSITYLYMSYKWLCKDCLISLGNNCLRDRGTVQTI